MAENFRETPRDLIQNDHSLEERDRWIATASIDEIIELMQLISPKSPTFARAKDEINQRLRRHRPGREPEMAPVYIMAAMAVVLAAVAAWPVIRGWTKQGGLDAAPPRAAQAQTNELSSANP